MNILLHGAGGAMGRVLVSLLSKPQCEDVLCACVDMNTEGLPTPAYDSLAKVMEKPDVVIDFSHHSATPALVAYATRHACPLVIATTGQTDEEHAAVLDAATHIPVFYSANMSVGVALMSALVRQTVRAFPHADIEIIEKHHNRKLDVPSGTALMLARSAQDARPGSVLHIGRHENGKRKKEEIGIHSLRMGNVVGIHEIIVSTENETVTLRHEAHSRSLFAEGALVAARYLVGKPAGLYTLADMFKE